MSATVTSQYLDRTPVTSRTYQPFEEDATEYAQALASKAMDNSRNFTISVDIENNEVTIRQSTTVTYTDAGWTAVQSGTDSGIVQDFFINLDGPINDHLENVMDMLMGGGDYDPSETKRTVRVNGREVKLDRGEKLIGSVTAQDATPTIPQPNVG